MNASEHSCWVCQESKALTILNYTTYQGCVYSKQAQEIWYGTVFSKRKTRLSSTDCKSGKSPNSVFQFSKCNPFCLQTPIMSPSINRGEHGDPKQVTVKFWSPLLLWVTKSFVCDLGISCHYPWNSNRLFCQFVSRIKISRCYPVPDTLKIFLFIPIKISPVMVILFQTVSDHDQHRVFGFQFWLYY